MNAFLAQLFGFFNAVIGFLIVAFGVLIGVGLVTGREINGISIHEAAPMAIAAVIVAIVIAVLLCGLIALLAEIERHLREMKQMNLDRLKYSAELRSKSEPSL